MGIQNQSSVSVRSCKNDLYANILRKFLQIFNFIEQQRRIATVAKIKERKSYQWAGAGATYPPSFVSNRGSIVWHLNSMRNEDIPTLPFCDCDCESKTIGICMHFKFIDIDRLDCSCLLFFLYFFNFSFFDFLRCDVAAAGIWQLRFLEVSSGSQPSKCHPSFWWVFCILRNVVLLLCLHVVPTRRQVTRISVIESFILFWRSLGNHIPSKAFMKKMVVLEILLNKN